MEPQTLRHVISSRVINHELISSQGKGGAGWEQQIQKPLDKLGIRQELWVLSLQCSHFSSASSLQSQDFSSSSCRINSAGKETVWGATTSNKPQSCSWHWEGNYSHCFKSPKSWWAQGSSSPFPQLGVVFPFKCQPRPGGTGWGCDISDQPGCVSPSPCDPQLCFEKVTGNI